MIFKCPCCGDYYSGEESFRSHLVWKHSIDYQFSLSAFEAPSYGLNSNADEWNRRAASFIQMRFRRKMAVIPSK